MKIRHMLHVLKLCSFLQFESITISIRVSDCFLIMRTWTVDIFALIDMKIFTRIVGVVWVIDKGLI
jgi:hypothetical protein